MSAPTHAWLKRVEGSRRPLASCSVCAAGLVVLVVLAYQVAPFGKLEARVLSDLTAPSGSFVNHTAVLAEQLVSPLSQVVAVVLACLIALCLGRPHRAFIAVALVAGTAVVVQALKIALAHPRYQPILGHSQIGSTGFPSGNSAGALSIALAFLYVVPHSWWRPTAAVGVCFTLAVSVGLLALRYHYPSDVLGGWLVAVGWCFALIAMRVADGPAAISSLSRS